MNYTESCITQIYELHRYMNYTSLYIIQVHILHKSIYYTSPYIIQIYELHKSISYTRPCIIQIHEFYNLHDISITQVHILLQIQIHVLLLTQFHATHILHKLINHTYIISIYNIFIKSQCVIYCFRIIYYNQCHRFHLIQSLLLMLYKSLFCPTLLLCHYINCPLLVVNNIIIRYRPSSCQIPFSRLIPMTLIYIIIINKMHHRRKFRPKHSSYILYQHRILLDTRHNKQ